MKREDEKMDKFLDGLCDALTHTNVGQVVTVLDGLICEDCLRNDRHVMAMLLRNAKRGHYADFVLYSPYSGMISDDHLGTCDNCLIEIEW